MNTEDCNVTANSESVGIPYVDGSRKRQDDVYSCTSSRINNNYFIHVISAYRAGWFNTHHYDPTYASNVCIKGNGSLLEKPLVIVLATYRPTQWIIHIPKGIVVSKVIPVNI